MIDNVLKIIKDEANTFMRLKIQGTELEYIHLVPVINLDGKPSVKETTVCMTLVRIDEDRTNMSGSTQMESNTMGTQTYKAPVKLNLYVLFSAAYSDGQERNYTEALKRISLVVAFFQSKNVFTCHNTPSLDPTVGKLTVELCNLNLEEQNNLWSMLGGAYRPSILYLFRTLVFQEKHTLDTGSPVLEKNLELTEKK